MELGVNTLKQFVFTKDMSHMQMFSHLYAKGTKILISGSTSCDDMGAMCDEPANETSECTKISKL